MLFILEYARTLDFLSRFKVHTGFFGGGGGDFGWGVGGGERLPLEPKPI